MARTTLKPLCTNRHLGACKKLPARLVADSLMRVVGRSTPFSGIGRSCYPKISHVSKVERGLISVLVGNLTSHQTARWNEVFSGAKQNLRNGFFCNPIGRRGAVRTNSGQAYSIPDASVDGGTPGDWKDHRER